MNSSDYEAVIRTNDDAVECRWSAVQAGLLPSECVLEGSLHRRPWPRAPLINRGTFIRTVHIDEQIAGGNYDCIVNLGAGFDTRPLRIRKKASWAEVDLPEVIQKKHRLLRLNSLGYPAQLIPADLNAKLDLNLALSGRTLLLAECIFPYLECKDRIKDVMAALRPDEVLLFEPIALGDPFGKLLLQNVPAPMPSIFQDIDQLAGFYRSIGYTVNEAYPLDRAPLSDGSARIVQEKGALDEYEEWTLMCRHYYFVKLGRNSL